MRRMTTPVRLDPASRSAGRWFFIAILLGTAVDSGCATVDRYGPKEDAVYPWRQRATTRPPERRSADEPEPVRPNGQAAQGGPGFGSAAALAGALGDGTIADELVAGARRLVGLRFGGEDATLASEQASFEAHLAAVAAWSGGSGPGRGAVGELWVGADGRIAVIDAPLGGGRWRVIGPAEGEDGVRVRQREVSGGTPRQALAVDVSG